MKRSITLNQPVWVIVAVVVLAALLAFSLMRSMHHGMMTMPTPTSPATPATATVQLNAQNNSGESGTATLTAMGNQTKVVITLNGAPSDTAQPTHIHKGTCDNLDPNPTYPLNDVQNGKSETTINASLPSLMMGNFSINVHKSATEISTYVACGTIPKS
jgi:hypothetical protein